MKNNKERSDQFAETIVCLGVLLTIVFAVLKLLNIVDWSWGWVLSPILIPVGISAVIVILVFVVLIISIVINGKRK